MKVTDLKIGDKVYSSYFGMDINEIEAYTIIDIRDGAIVLPNDVYKNSPYVVPFKDLDKKLSCFFTTYEKQVENIGHNIRKAQRHFERRGDKERLQRYLDLEVKYLKDRERKGV